MCQCECRGSPITAVVRRARRSNPRHIYRKAREHRGGAQVRQATIYAGGGLSGTYAADAKLTGANTGSRSWRDLTTSKAIFKRAGNRHAPAVAAQPGGRKTQQPQTNVVRFARKW